MNATMTAKVLSTLLIGGAIGTGITYQFTTTVQATCPVTAPQNLRDFGTFTPIPLHSGKSYP